jgi:hypothetical protein
MALVVLCAAHCINMNMRCLILVMLYFIIISVFLLFILHCVIDHAANTVGFDSGNNFCKSCVDP